MPCHHITVDGVSAIVCTSGRTQKCRCGRKATRLCDWKVKGRKSGTCDKPLCARCSHSPAPEKDLCPQHAAEWKNHPRSKQ